MYVFTKLYFMRSKVINDKRFINKVNVVISLCVVILIHTFIKAMQIYLCVFVDALLCDRLTVCLGIVFFCPFVNLSHCDK